jgi:hypothetical protein
MCLRVFHYYRGCRHTNYIAKQSELCYKVKSGEATPGNCRIGKPEGDTYSYDGDCPQCVAEGKISKPNEGGNKKRKPDGGNGSNAGVKNRISRGGSKKGKKAVK